MPKVLGIGSTFTYNRVPMTVKAIVTIGGKPMVQVRTPRNTTMLLSGAQVEKCVVG